jgi:muramoyltetrapeptide carboxypeptidase
MFVDPAVKAIIASSGGYSAISVLELLDYDLIHQNPKPFMGMSDMTNYHLALYAKTGLLGFHMDEVCFGMGMNWQKAEPEVKRAAQQLYKQTLTKPTAAGVMPAWRERKVWRVGQVEGRLIGGNISSLAQLVGTPYFPPLDWFDGAILFWEAVGLHRYDMAQKLYQLKYHGVFERLGGMLVGTISAVQPARDKSLVEPTAKEIVLEILKAYRFPIMAGMDFGHYTVNQPMPLGLRVVMDCKSRTLEFLEPAVR